MSPTPIASHLPSPLKEWWEWTEVGFESWRIDVWAVIGWFLAVIALALVAPIAGVGQLCRQLRRLTR